MKQLWRNLAASLAITASSAIAVPVAHGEPIDLKVMSFNIWYGGEQVNFDKVVQIIRQVDPDIVGVQEPDDNLSKLAAATGLVYYDNRRDIISRYPIFDPGLGERTKPGTDGYGIAGLNPDGIHALIMVRPGKVVAMANTHLSYDPEYGPDAVVAGKSADEVIAIENDTRGKEGAPLAALGKLTEQKIPVFLTGDFNSPSHLDWTDKTAAVRSTVKYPLAWPVTVQLEKAGFRDSYREIFPDPVKKPGLTWTAGTPTPVIDPTWPLDRIDFVFAAGPSVTRNSQIVGEQDGPDVDVPFKNYPSDHRAVVSTFSVEPADAKPMIAVEPRRVVQGGRFMLRYHLPAQEYVSMVVVKRGENPDAAITGIYEENVGYRTGLRLSTFGMEPGNYDAVLLGEGKKEVSRTRFTIVSPDSKPMLEIVGPVKGGTDPSVRVRWSGAAGNRHDWLGIFKANDPGVTNYFRYDYTDARFEGEMDIPLKSSDGAFEPGNYDVRLMNDDAYVELARATFTIK
jgi:endonuclease/exonuclease/phosphatase family metal-dependent hydrolase